MADHHLHWCEILQGFQHAVCDYQELVIRVSELNNTMNGGLDHPVEKVEIAKNPSSAPLIQVFGELLHAFHMLNRNLKEELEVATDSISVEAPKPHETFLQGAPLQGTVRPPFVTNTSPRPGEFVRTK